MASRRRTVHSVLQGSTVLTAPEIDTVDLFGVVLPTDPQGCTHLMTWGRISVILNTLPVSGDSFIRFQMAARQDTAAIAALASADLLPLRDFSAAGANVGDRSWRSRRYLHSYWTSGRADPVVPLGNTDPQVGVWSARRLGTLDADEGWYLYLYSAGVDVTVFYDLETTYMLP